MGEVITVGEVLHSALGASSAHRWMKCPGSIRLTKQLGDRGRKAGRAAREGTAAHRVAEHCLDKGIDVWELADVEIKVDGDKFPVDQEMIEGVQLYLDAVRDKLEKFPGAQLFVEESMASILHDDAFGTSDSAILVPGDRLIIFDLKYGRGVSVEPDSVQNKYYGYLGVENIDDSVKVVELYIVQPRMPHPKGPVRRHVTNPKELTDWFTDEVLPAMLATDDPESGLEVGTHCRFCPARDACPALKGEVFNFNPDLDPEYLTSEEVGQLLERGDAIRRYLESLEFIALQRALGGDRIYGRKLVRKKANRVLKDGASDKAREKWGDEALTEPKVKSPAQLEKLEGGKDWVAANAYTPDAGLTLAPISDKRSEIRPLRDRVNAA